jgi:hypothetical protein
VSLHPAEEATIRAFVVPAKRDRWLSLLASKTRRAKALDLLNHFRDWDPRFVHSFDNQSKLLRALLAAGAPADCHVISNDHSLDGRQMPLTDAIEAAENYSFASVLCCVPGELACFFDEIAAPRRRLILRRA